MNRLIPIIVPLLLVGSACSKTADNNSNANTAARSLGTADKTTHKATPVVAPTAEPPPPLPTQSVVGDARPAQGQPIPNQKKTATTTHIKTSNSATKTPEPANQEAPTVIKHPSTQKRAKSKPDQSSKTTSAKPVWLTSEKLARTRAKKLKRKILVDFGASWCLPCEQYEKITFADKKVAAKLASMVLLKFDVSANSDADKALQQRFAVKTLPALLVLSPAGKELKRITKFLKPMAFLAALGN